MAARRVQVVAERICRIPEVIGDRHLVSTTVGPLLNPVLLSLEQTPDYRTEQPGSASFPKLRATRLNHFRIHHRVTDGVWTSIDLPETYENYHHIQPLAQQHWLLVRARAADDGDRNAHIFDESAQHVRSFHAGDGIEDVQVSEDDQIWVSYFDEGV